MKQLIIPLHINRNSVKNKRDNAVLIQQTFGFNEPTVSLYANLCKFLMPFHVHNAADSRRFSFEVYVHALTRFYRESFLLIRINLITTWNKIVEFY